MENFIKCSFRYYIVNPQFLFSAKIIWASSICDTYLLTLSISLIIKKTDKKSIVQQFINGPLLLLLNIIIIIIIITL